MSEWGPVIKHDGKGCPVVGMYCLIKNEYGMEQEGIVPHHAAHRPKSSWFWEDTDKSDNPKWRIIEYRIRKPKGLTILESILREVEHTRTPEYTAG